MKRGREEWAQLVDAISNDVSTEPVKVPRGTSYDRSMVLPFPISGTMTEFLSYCAQNHANLADTIQPRISFQEGMHAKPVDVHITDTFGGTEKALTERRATELKAIYQRLLSESPSTSTSNKKSGSSSNELMIRNEDLPFGTTNRLTAGFFRAGRFQAQYKRPDFLPIILVPSAPSAPIQLVNATAFFQEGRYVNPHTVFMDPETGETHREEARENTASVTVVPMSYDKAKYRVTFHTFLVVDDPKSIQNWDHVCACLVQDNGWQFDNWFPNEPAKRQPSVLFSEVRGFLPYFEEDKIPQKVSEWKIKPLILTRKLTKETSHVAQAFTFWEELYTFMDTNPRFSKYSLEP